MTTYASHLRRRHYSAERWDRLYRRAMRLYSRRTGWSPEPVDITNAVAAPKALGTSRQARPGFFFAVVLWGVECAALGWVLARALRGEHPWN